MCLHRKDDSMEQWQVVNNQDRDNHYKLASYSLHQENQFTCVLFCNGKGIIMMA